MLQVLYHVMIAYIEEIKQPRILLIAVRTWMLNQRLRGC